jgi:hypothetical protein
VASGAFVALVCVLCVAAAGTEPCSANITCKVIGDDGSNWAQFILLPLVYVTALGAAWCVCVRPFTANLSACSGDHSRGCCAVGSVLCGRSRGKRI